MKLGNGFLRISVLCGLLFLYLPILSMIVFSFNRSSLGNIWAGFSLKWYARLFANDEVIAALGLSLRIAFLSATLATVLGTLAALALARFGAFRGRAVFSGTVLAPLVLPEVIAGIALLMLFILMARWIGWPTQRGFLTVTLAHATYSMAFVTTVIRARLVAMDISVEEAAMDLGSTPWQVLRDITLPVIAPSLLAGWLLAFTLSLDDVVIANFTTGPGATTLPMVIWSKVKMGITPDINALASLIIVSVALLVLAGTLMMGFARRGSPD
ncbi:ABC transporter permease subunit [Pseudooceanicola sp. CBS1P-1]|uniref:ABC transporter permease subunit n=1 Tax=Pseudooceanicola albus TaxID=2692189 RepID=A0A6L7GBU6_9RHOB|nr:MULTISPECIES: ABC transporter permease subunit [Pseudooceanicola]MBT9386856.1 ABC transporter permease subunit [Pseudooceanicola endophyticus]MXN21008.1 ABC transporter permease subunit [Pseudooceanicola albus]